MSLGLAGLLLVPPEMVLAAKAAAPAAAESAAAGAKAPGAGSGACAPCDCSAPVAAAPKPAAPANPDFEAARELFMNFQFDEVVPRLQKALEAPAITLDEKIEIYKLLAFTYTSLDQPEQAQQSFIKLLEVQEDSRLSSGASPRFLTAFADAQKMFRARKPVKLKHEPPMATAMGLTTSVDVTAVEGSERVGGMTLHYRLKGGTGGFGQMEMAKGDEGAFSARMPTVFPGPAGRRTVEYFIRARDTSGALVASVGEEAKPFEMLIESEELKVAKPFYKQWLFWGAVGAVAAGAAVAIPLATQQDVAGVRGSLGLEKLPRGGAR